MMPCYQAAFASVTVWLFPAPVEMTSELSKELSSTDLSEVRMKTLEWLRRYFESYRMRFPFQSVFDVFRK